MKKTFGKTTLLNAAYKNVQELKPKADKIDTSCPLWYGWALIDSFLAGAIFMNTLRNESDNIKMLAGYDDDGEEVWI